MSNARRLGLSLGLSLGLLSLAACPREPAPSSTVQVSNFDDDEVVRFIPTFGTATAGGWSIPIEAWVFEPEEDGVVRSAALELIEEALEAKFDEATTEQVASKLRPFLVDNERGKHVVVAIGDVSAHVCTSGSDGRCSGTVDVPATAPGMVGVQLVLPATDSRMFVGQAQLLDEDGVSVLSDIDDTIKITEVHDKKKLIDNTFVRPFRPTPGVVELYQRWQSQGAAFHYVSNSPLPLLDAIDGFITRAGYPKGSIRLKPFRWSDGTFVELLAAPEDHKLDVIAQHLERFEQRRFILVGDTGERDPEIYADIRRRFEDRIAKIYLRNTGSMSEPELAARLAKAFDGLPPELWVVFEDGSSITDDLPAG